MTKPPTVTQMRNRFQGLIDEGHGSLPVLTHAMNPASNPKVVHREAREIGPSEWDGHTFALGPEGSGMTVLL